MQTWLIEPRDPLIVRDGRPFSADIAGARATSLDFPFPSTTTGGVRTREGVARGGFATRPNEAEKHSVARLIKELKEKVEVRGPLLVELSNDGEVSDWLMPAPTDALWCNWKAECDGHSPNDRAQLIRLAPLKMPSGAFTNLPSDDLSPVGTWQSFGKPFEGAPRYWRSESFKEWLTNPRSHEEVSISDWGHDGPVKETRTHVGILPASQTALDGALYQTRGLEFTHQGKPQLVGGQRLALAIWTTAENLSEDIVPFGGERRLTHWRSSKKSIATEFLECNEAVVEAIKESKDGDSYFCRLILLTPAHFTNGFSPGWIGKAKSDFRIELKGAAINRPQVVSGWDFDRTKSLHGQPNATRRLAPAGSVYFLRLSGPFAKVQEWCTKTWLHCVSDAEQDCRDGFGLSLIGTWSGKYESPEVNS
jgi:CRISPR-associated protein Cmr3